MSHSRRSRLREAVERDKNVSLAWPQRDQQQPPIRPRDDPVEREPHRAHWHRGVDGIHDLALEAPERLGDLAEEPLHGRAGAGPGAAAEAAGAAYAGVAGVADAGTAGSGESCATSHAAIRSQRGRERLSVTISMWPGS